MHSEATHEEPVEQLQRLPKQTDNEEATDACGIVPSSDGVWGYSPRSAPRCCQTTVHIHDDHHRQLLHKSFALSAFVSANVKRDADLPGRDGVCGLGDL